MKNVSLCCTKCCIKYEIYVVYERFLSFTKHTHSPSNLNQQKKLKPKTQPIPPTADEQPPAESFQFVNSFQFRPIKINFMLLSNKATLGRPSPSQSRPSPGPGSTPTDCSRFIGFCRLERATCVSRRVDLSVF